MKVKEASQKDDEGVNMEKNVFRSYLETAAIFLSIIGSVIASMLWMNGKFTEIDHRFNQLEKDIAVIKTVMVMKNIMPSELCQNNKE